MASEVAQQVKTLAAKPDTILISRDSTEEDKWPTPANWSLTSTHGHTRGCVHTCMLIAAHNIQVHKKQTVKE